MAKISYAKYETKTTIPTEKTQEILVVFGYKNDNIDEFQNRKYLN